MKKRIALLCGMIGIFCLTACGADNTDSSQNNTENIPVADVGPGMEEDFAAASEETAGEESAGGSRTLIAYFSVPEDVDTSGVDAVVGASIVVKDEQVMGNTEYVAKLIQQTVGGDLFRIEIVSQYLLDHDPLVDQVAEEQDADARPELATYIEHPEQYETIFLGYPNWLAYHNLIQCTQA